MEAAARVVWQGDLSLSILEKAVLVLAVAYVVSPIDAVPDVIPVIGWIDDGIAMFLCYFVLSSVIAFAPGYLRAVRQVGCSTKEPVMFNHDDDEECVICEGERGARNTTLLPCGHQFCHMDAETLAARRARCPFCRRQISGLQQLQHQHVKQQHVGE